MAEHGLTGDRPVIGLAFDGTGYGDDGAIWGGEFLIADIRRYRARSHHLVYPTARRRGSRPRAMADGPGLAAVCRPGLGDGSASGPPCGRAAEQLSILGRQLELGLNAPLTSSAGRLFDAVAALIGVRQSVNYEAQAAIELEALAAQEEPAATLRPEQR
jgi:hydrogenase maturation protein HypF